MQTELLQEARRQADICNACRYCEGYCAVFPDLHARRTFTDADLTQLANLCHNCRGCYYACQYTAPHEFHLNLPKALAEVRHASWLDFAWPQPLARVFHNSGVSIAVTTMIGFALLLLLIMALPGDGDGFYAALSHNAMVALFLPAFLFPVLSLAISMRRYWRATEGGQLNWSALQASTKNVATLKNLSGGHGDGCNFEDEDRFTHSRRFAHQAVMYGFLLCFLSTSAGTVLHYVFDSQAPYGFWSLPKLLGVPGGLLMVIGTLWLAHLKLAADKHLADQSAWGGEMAFILLLFLVASTGLVLYGLGGTSGMPVLLALHLGSVLSFFLLTPYTKMAHGFYRLAALLRSGKSR